MGPLPSRPRTLVEKIWDDHVVATSPGAPDVLYVDLHLVHEVTSPQAFSGLRARGLGVRRPDLTVATADHSTPTHDRSLPILDQQAAFQVQQLGRNCAEFGIPLYGLGSERQGIVHVIGPELGLTQPGMTIVCGDSHTATHGAFGALAFGIGTSEVEMVLATQCLLQRRPRTYEVRVDGRLRPGVSAKDIILALIARIGIGGGTGHVFEYTGEAIRALSMEERMTVCNMSIEGGARAGLIAPDDTTFEYVSGRPYAPHGPAWDAAVARWRTLPSDPDATYDARVTLAAGDLEPMVTYGTNPGMGVPITGRVPAPDSLAEPAHQRALAQALSYMDLAPGQALLGQRLDVVFIGSCTNSRISDLRQAAGVLRGRRVADGLRVLVVPGSQQVKAQAELEGLDEVFRAAGAEWREAGCSMCIAMNGDQLTPGQYALSHQQPQLRGPPGQGRTHLPGLAPDRGGQRPDGRHHRPAHRGDGMSEPYASFTSAVIPFPAENVDTDQIIPARFLKTTEKSGLASALFNDWRYAADGAPRPDFVLNRPAMQGRQILLAGDNFGCGSSREHAPWALTAWGIRAILSTGFADIFRNNAMKNGLLPIVVEAERHRQLFALVAAQPDVELRVDLEEQLVHLPGDEDLPFDVDPFAKRMLLAGTDEVGYLLDRGAATAAYEAAHPARIDTRPAAG